MKDEIKEILEKLYYHVNYGIEHTYCEDLITTGELQTLLDYITNLQEEIKSANESITWWTNRFKTLQEANKKLKNEPLTNKMSRIDSVVANIYRENEAYKSRCEKAIEILKDTSVDMPETLLIETIDYARHILIGGDEK